MTEGNGTPEALQPEPPQRETRQSSFKYRLRKPDGAILAKSPSRIQALKTAEAMFDDIEVRENVRTGAWALFSGGQLKALIDKG